MPTQALQAVNTVQPWESMSVSPPVQSMPTSSAPGFSSTISPLPAQSFYPSTPSAAHTLYESSPSTELYSSYPSSPLPRQDLNPSSAQNHDLPNPLAPFSFSPLEIASARGDETLDLRDHRGHVGQWREADVPSEHCPPLLPWNASPEEMFDHMQNFLEE